MKNLREALEHYLVTQHKVINEVHAAAESAASEDEGTAVVPHIEAAIEAESEQDVIQTHCVSNAKQQQRQQRFEMVKTLHHQGLSIRAIAQRLDISRGIATTICG